MIQEIIQTLNDNPSIRQNRLDDVLELVADALSMYAWASSISSDNHHVWNDNGYRYIRLDMSTWKQLKRTTDKFRETYEKMIKQNGGDV